MTFVRKLREAVPDVLVSKFYSLFHKGTAVFMIPVFLSFVFISACSSSTVIQTIPAGARVYVDGQLVGESPAVFSDSAISGTSHDVSIEKAGYFPLRGTFRRDGEFNVGTCIGGVFFLIPFFWVMDYKKFHVFALTEMPKDPASHSGPSSNSGSSSGSVAQKPQPIVEPQNTYSPPAPSYSNGTGAPVTNSLKQRTVVAVFEIVDRSSGFAKGLIRGLSEYYAAQVGQISGARLVPQNQIRDALRNEKAESFKSCYDEQCQIELGKALAAQKTVLTTLVKIGKTCALAGQLFDLKSETTDVSATVEGGCSEDELLKSSRALAEKLALGTWSTPK